MRQFLSVALLLLATASSARAQRDTSALPDTTPATVVQRFVDAANARDASAMGALVAPNAVFASFPDGRVLVQTRDSIQAYYSRLLQSLPQGFHIKFSHALSKGRWSSTRSTSPGCPASDNRRPGFTSCATG